MFEKQKAAWHDIRISLQALGRTGKLLWQTDRRTTGLLLLSSGLRISTPVISTVLSRSIQKKLTSSNTRKFQQVVSLYILQTTIMMGQTAIGYVIGNIQTRAQEKVTLALQKLILEKTQQLDLADFESNRVYNELEDVRNAIYTNYSRTIRTSLWLATEAEGLSVSIISSVLFEPLLLLPIGLHIATSFKQYGKTDDIREQEKVARVEGNALRYLYDTVLTNAATAKEMRIFQLGQPLTQEFVERSDQLQQNTTKIARHKDYDYFLVEMFQRIMSGIANGMMLRRAWDVPEKRMQLGETTTQYAQIVHKFGNVQYHWGSIIDIGKSLNELYTFLIREPTILSGTRLLDVHEEEGITIDLDHVSFRHTESAAWAVQDVSLHIPAHTKLALVGQNGAGKSTLIKLLCRLYDPTEGRILFNGIDLREYDLESIRASMSVIFQDYARYNLTLRENIGFGNFKLLHDEEQLQRAIHMAGLEELIASMDAGIDTLIGEGGRLLSGGEWQRVALARAFFRDSPLLILDEPTAALDAEKEFDLFQRFYALTSGKTSILVSHKFSTVRLAEQIVVLERGKVLEQGTHSALLAAKGKYARMFRLQAKGYR